VSSTAPLDIPPAAAVNVHVIVLPVALAVTWDGLGDIVPVPSSASTANELLVPVSVEPVFVAVIVHEFAPGETVTDCGVRTPLTKAAVVPLPAVSVHPVALRSTVPVKLVTVLLSES
jgi:hypothetical protein